MYRSVIAFLFLLAVLQPALPQTRLSEEDVRQVVAHYKDFEVASFKMPPPVTDKIFRDSIHRNLPNIPLVNNPHLTDALSRALHPVVSLYGRSYDLLIIDTDRPIVMSDSGVVLAVSTGMIRQAKTDDELLGYAAHEVGHEFFLLHSIYSRFLVAISGEPVLKRHAEELLILIELECDAFAAVTLNYLGYNSLEFIRSIEQGNHDFPGENIGHPPDSLRRYLVEKLSRKAKPRQSEAFKDLKRLVRLRTTNS